MAQHCQAWPAGQYCKRGGRNIVPELGEWIHDQQMLN